jgi:hypothetical protein
LSSLQQNTFFYFEPYELVNAAVEGSLLCEGSAMMHKSTQQIPLQSKGLVKGALRMRAPKIGLLGGN